MDHPWWANFAATAPDDTMTYECDAKLGNPRPVDCSQLQYSELGVLSDNISLKPGSAEYLHFGTCSIGVSASESLILTWDQITAAVNNLIGACVNRPFAKAVGGRAYHGWQNTVGSAGRRKKKRGASGVDALPPGANITLFQQLEHFSTFPTASEEVNTCTWRQVLSHEDVRTCRNVHHRTNPLAAQPPCLAARDCPIGQICAMDDGIPTDGTVPATFSCVTMSARIAAVGLGQAIRCRGRCLSLGNATFNLPPGPVNASDVALLPMDTVCPCNCTYISHTCCLSRTSLAGIETSPKVNVSIQMPNGSIHCDAETGLWVGTSVEELTLRDN